MHLQTNTALVCACPLYVPSQPFVILLVSNNNSPQRLYIQKRYCTTSPGMIGFSRSFLPSLLGVKAVGTKNPLPQSLRLTMMVSFPTQLFPSVTCNQYMPG